MNISKTATMNKLMWGFIAALFLLPMVMIAEYWLYPQPKDVLKELVKFKTELLESRQEIEGELLRRTRDRIYKSQINDLIQKNNLLKPSGWDD